MKGDRGGGGCPQRVPSFLLSFFLFLFLFPSASKAPVSRDFVALTKDLRRLGR